MQSVGQEIWTQRFPQCGNVCDIAPMIGQEVLMCRASLQGFYTVYSTVFQKLAAEEREAAAAAQSRQQDHTVASDFPAFGEHALLTLLLYIWFQAHEYVRLCQSSYEVFMPRIACHESVAYRIDPGSEHVHPVHCQPWAALAPTSWLLLPQACILWCRMGPAC